MLSAQGFKQILVLLLFQGELLIAQQNAVSPKLLPAPSPLKDTALLEVAKSCLLPAGNEDMMLGAAAQRAEQGKVDEFTRKNLGKFNVRCDHQRLLREGVSVHALSSVYHRRKLAIAEKMLREGIVDVGGKRTRFAKDSNLIGHFAFDGTCLFKDYQSARSSGVEAGFELCKKRLKKLILDANLDGRENMLAYNDARDQLTGGKNSAVLIAAADTAPDVSTSRVTKDIRAFAKLSAQEKQSREQAFRQENPQQLLSQVQSVEFGVGAATMRAASVASQNGLFAAKQQDLSQNARTLTGEGGKPLVVEVNDQSRQASFVKAAGQLNLEQRKMAMIKQVEEQDYRATIEARARKEIKQLTGVPLVSELALEGIMDEAINEANKVNGRLPKEGVIDPSKIDQKDVEISISSTGEPRRSKPSVGSTSQPSEGTLDSSIEQALPDLMDSLRKEAP